MSFLLTWTRLEYFFCARKVMYTTQTLERCIEIRKAFQPFGPLRNPLLIRSPSRPAGHLQYRPVVDVPSGTDQWKVSTVIIKSGRRFLLLCGSAVKRWYTSDVSKIHAFHAGQIMKQNDRSSFATTAVGSPSAQPTVDSCERRWILFLHERYNPVPSRREVFSRLHSRRLFLGFVLVNGWDR